MKKETRSFHAQSSKLDDTDGGKIIEGHAVVFDSPTWIGGKFIEVIDRNALNGCDLSDVSLLVNHNGNSLPLARTTSGTLSLSVDNIGLAIRAKLDVENNPLAKALYSVVSRGDCHGMSFAFTVDDDKWQGLETTMPTRVIKRIKKIYEVSAVTEPAYPQTDLNARAKKLLGGIKMESKMESMMRMLKKLEERRNVYIDRSNKSNDLAELREINKEVKKLSADIDELRDAIIEGRTDVIKNSPEYIPGKGFIPAAEGRNKSLDSALEQREKAGNDLKENRTVESSFDVFGERRTMTLEPASGQEATLINPSYSSQSINPDFTVVSSLVDAVQHLYLPGGDSFKQPYITGIDTGDYTQEGDDYNNAETQFDFATINRAKLTAYAENPCSIRKNTWRSDAVFFFLTTYEL